MRRLASFAAAVLSSYVLLACGGAVAPVPDQQSSGGSSGKSGSSGGSGSTTTSGGSTTGDPGINTGPSRNCTVGSYAFCRCSDGSEGTKLCASSGTFDACSCDMPPICHGPAMPVNPPGCPATYSHAYQDQPCPEINLECVYVGAGDPGGPGQCNATAGLQCRVAPGGSLHWTATQ